MTGFMSLGGGDDSCAPHELDLRQGEDTRVNAILSMPVTECLATCPEGSVAWWNTTQGFVDCEATGNVKCGSGSTTRGSTYTCCCPKSMLDPGAAPPAPEPPAPPAWRPYAVGALALLGLAAGVFAVYEHEQR